jgi:hypothetical protein
MNPSFLYYFAAAMLGHFVGDYLFQNEWMATRKWKPGMTGHVACTVHVLLYTLAIALFTGWHPLFLLVVAVPHWIIDRWSLAKYLLRWKNGYDIKDTWEMKSGDLIENAVLERNVWKVAFAAPVYIFNDNTIHWVCLWFTCRYFF